MVKTTYLPRHSGFEKCPITDSTVLLIHSNTTNGSVVFTDSSGKEQEITTSDAGGGDVKHSTVNSKFGTSSIRTQNGEYLIITDSDDFAFGSNDFTIDFWIRSETFPTISGIFQQYLDGDNWLWGFNTTEGIFTVEFNLTGSVLITLTTAAMSVDTWHHIALVRNSSTWNLYLNGKLQNTDTDASAVPNWAADFELGRRATGLPYSGNIDEFRVTNGEALWKGDFTPPRSPAY